MDLAAAHAHVQELVREGDKDRYLAGLFAPDDRRGNLFALYAFNVELARTRDLVREPALGEIRLQFWSDQIEAMFGGDTPEHPVGQALAAAIEAGTLPHRAFAAMIEARRFDLYDDPMPTLNDLEGYLGETSSALVQLAGLLLAGPAAQSAAGAAGGAGVAIGIAGLLRSLPLHRSRGQCYIPRDVLERHDVTVAHILAGRQSAAVGAVLHDMRAQARRRLGEARAQAGLVPKEALPAFLPSALVDRYLAALDAAGVKLLTEPVDVPQWRRQLALVLAAWRDRY